MPGGPSGYEVIVLEGEGGSYEEESQDRASGWNTSSLTGKKILFCWGTETDWRPSWWGGASCLGLDRLPPWWVTVLHFCSRLPSQPWQALKFPGCCSSSPPQECAGLDMLISPSTVPCPAQLLCLSWNRGGQTECLMGFLTHWLRAACSVRGTGVDTNKIQ